MAPPTASCKILAAPVLTPLLAQSLSLRRSSTPRLITPSDCFRGVSLKECLRCPCSPTDDSCSPLTSASVTLAASASPNPASTSTRPTNPCRLSLESDERKRACARGAAVRRATETRTAEAILDSIGEFVADLLVASLFTCDRASDGWRTCLLLNSLLSLVRVCAACRATRRTSELPVACHPSTPSAERGVVKPSIIQRVGVILSFSKFRDYES